MAKPLQRIPEIEHEILTCMYIASICQRIGEVRHYASALARNIANAAPVEGGLILDIGCGTGNLAYELARLFRNSQVKAIDKDELMVESARRLNPPAPNLEFELGDVYKLNGTNANLVTVVDAFHHFDEPDAALSKIHKSLNPGGYLYIEDLDRADQWLPENPLFNLAYDIRQKFSDGCAFALFQHLGFFSNPERTRLIASFLSHLAAYDADEMKRKVAKHGFAIKGSVAMDEKYKILAQKL